MSDEEEEGGSSGAGRIFINNLDCYLTKNIALHLATCKPGQALDEAEEEPQDEEEAGLLQEPEEPTELKLTGYKIVGTLKNPTSQKPAFVEEILNCDSRRAFYEHIIECDTVIYDITSDPKQIDEVLWVASSLEDDFERFTKKKVLILVTHLLSWLRTKSVDSASTHPIFSEEGHRKRKPHPLYSRHLDAEKAILRSGKRHRSRFSTYVFGCGIPYGAEEGIFAPFFKEAWLNKKQLEVYGPGDNMIPTIHVKDLAALIQAVLEARPRTRYMIAKDSSQNTLGEIIAAISARFSTGDVRRMTAQEVDNLYKAPRYEIDQLTMDVSLEATILKEEYQIQWKSETGMVENMQTLAQEYLKSRDLKPLRICVLGAPFVGKTTLAMELARHYGLHYIHIQAVILEVYTRLRKLIKAAKKSKKGARERTMPTLERTPALLPTATSVDVADEHLGTPVVNAPADTTHTVSKISELPDEKPSTPPPSEVVLMSRLTQEVTARYPFDPEITWESDAQLEILASDAEEELKEFIRATSPECRVDDAVVINYLRKKLLSKPCQNQGFVLDGYPKTLEQAQLLFGPDTDYPEDPKNPQWNPLITPEQVIYLQASNALVTHRFRQMFPPEFGMEELEAPKQGLAFDPKAELARRKRPTSAQNGDKKTVNRNLKKLKIEWELPEEEPQHRLVRRLEEYRARMAPQAAAEIIEALLADAEHKPKKKATAEDNPDEALLPRRSLAPEVPDPSEKNVLTYFDLRELHPLVINMDADKTQLMKPNGPQMGAFEKAVKFIGPPTATATEYVRRAEGTFEEIAKQAEEAASEKEADYERRSEEANILLDQEEAIWVVHHQVIMSSLFEPVLNEVTADYLNLLKNENQERWDTKNLPRRNYLLQYVLPKVTESLVLFAENRSQDPIDFLAEYLLRNSK